MAAFLVDGLEHFEGRADAFTFFIEHEGAVFHAAGCEEADIAVAGEFLGRVACGGVVLGWDRGEGGWTDSVEMVRNQGFVGDEEEEGELFKYCDLGHPSSRDGLAIELVDGEECFWQRLASDLLAYSDPTTRVIVLGHVYTIIRPHG